MKRSAFFKSFIAVIAAPKILFEIKWAKPKPELNGVILSDLKFVTPSYLKDYVAKYGNEDFTWWLAEMNKQEHVTTIDFHYFESASGDTFTSPIAAPPVTITITNDNHES